jgi:LysM repeat protein
VLRGLVLVKRHGGRALSALRTPLLAVWRVSVRVIGVPLFRVFFLAKRFVSKLLLPAKSRVLFVFSNRYAFHVAAVVIVASAGTSNLHARTVRADTYGSNSMLYAMLIGDENEKVSVVSASETMETEKDESSGGSDVSYRDGVLDPFASDVDVGFEDYVTTAVGGDSVTALTMREGAESVAARDAVETYVVEDGDTLGGISDKFGLSLSTLLWANDLSIRSTIRPGQTMTISPVDGVIYTVKKGDTINSIAKTYSAETDRIIAFNKLSDADDLRVGESLVLPDGEPPAPVVRKIAPLSKLFDSAPSSSSGSSAKSTGTVVPSGTWVFPTDDHRVTLCYGCKEPWGAPHMGVDFAGSYKTHSYAATDGVVIYSGPRRGYGNTVEIDHGGGIVTRYGHHSKLLVKAGDVVKAGDTIAVTGSTGWSTGPHLHFEVIKNGKFQNPFNYIPR